MAIYKKGILGVFSGKVGTVIGSSWRGINYMKSLPKASGKKPSELQLAQRLKFTLVANFLRPIRPVIELGYGASAGSGSITSHNAAVSYHLAEAVMGIAPNFEMNYPKVIFSRGELPGPALPTLAVGNTGELNFTWLDNSAANLAKATDKAVLLVYCPTHKEFVYDDTETRASAGLNMVLPSHFVGEALQAWMAFFVADGKQVSTSVYLGTVTAI